MPVTHQIRGAILQRIKERLPVFPEIDGREEVKADVARALLSGAHPYLVSEEGTGKTRLARSLTNLLPSIPIIKGCPYNDDPKWPQELLCPRCRASQDPVKEFGIDLVPNSRRFSRIQGNEYTNEAKLLGLKDIQAIAHGKSPADPAVFTGTGVFRANRGILFVDELPSIRTKIQVLFHPILEEKKAILEEYNWQHPLDLIFVATGNPTGFAHVNDIPRPLLDRLELVYMELPDEQVEKQIILNERFQDSACSGSAMAVGPIGNFKPEDISRKVIAPWWVVDLINKAVRHSRTCPYVEKRPSIRAGIKALDHTYASAEIDNCRVANLRQAFYGLRLALRGRIGLRADLVDFEQPRKSIDLTEKLAEDFLWNAIETLRRDPVFLGGSHPQKVADQLARLLSGNPDLPQGRLPASVLSDFDDLKGLPERLLKYGPDSESQLYHSSDTQTVEEYNYSAIEMLANICIHEKTLSESKTGRLFIAREYQS